MSAGRVSLVIPVQDEELSILALLRSIAEQRRPPDEVVLVDAGSRDGTVERALSIISLCPLKIVRSERVHPGVARNHGVSASEECEWIAFTDGGIVLHPDWLWELLEAADEGTDAVLGNVDPICKTFFHECAAVAYVPARDHHGIRGPCVASCLVRRSTFTRVGGFPPYRAAEDLIFFEQLRAAAARVAYAPRAVANWQIAGTVRGTFGRFAGYSYHNLIAGRGRHWHAGVARLYALLAMTAGFAHLAGHSVLAWLTLPAFFGARAAKAAWVKRRSFAFSPFHPARVVGTASIILVIDLATAAGTWRWLVGRLRG
jgi:glycosyltransferase involved in cell wall biosynthesis